MLLNILQLSEQFPHNQGIIQSQMSAVPRVRNLSDVILLITHSINVIVQMSGRWQALCSILLTVVVQSPPPCPGAHIYLILLYRVHRAISHSTPPTPLPSTSGESEHIDKASIRISLNSGERRPKGTKNASS